MSAPRRVRLGAVSYLNSRPLTCGLDRDDLFDLGHGVPSACAGNLAAGGIDLGMIPAVEYARQDALRIVPGLAIGSQGEVISVRLFHRGRLGNGCAGSPRTPARALRWCCCGSCFASATASTPRSPRPPRISTPCCAAPTPPC